MTRDALKVYDKKAALLFMSTTIAFENCFFYDNCATIARFRHDFAGLNRRPGAPTPAYIAPSPPSTALEAGAGKAGDVGSGTLESGKAVESSDRSSHVKASTGAGVTRNHMHSAEFIAVVVVEMLWSAGRP